MACSKTSLPMLSLSENWKGEVRRGSLGGEQTLGKKCKQLEGSEIPLQANLLAWQKTKGFIMAKVVAKSCGVMGSAIKNLLHLFQEFL